MVTHALTDQSSRPSAPELDVSEWYNTPTPINLSALRGKVVILHAFQMLCPGCVLEGTPLAQRIHDRFANDELTLVGLHTVFEHHEAMKSVSLKAYLHEFRVTFPVGIDRHDARGGMPVTMDAYNMRGTPTLIAIDRNGRMAKQWFDRVDEIEIGMTLATLLAEAPPTSGE
jgi:peroxiredoxin